MNTENSETKEKPIFGLPWKDFLLTVLVLIFFAICFTYVFLSINNGGANVWEPIKTNERAFLIFIQINVLLALIVICFYRFYWSKNTATLYLGFVWIAHLVYKIFSIIAGILIFEDLAKFESFVVGIVAMIADVPLIVCSFPEKWRKWWLSIIPIVTIGVMTYLYDSSSDSGATKKLSYILSPAQSFLILLVLIYATVFKNNFNITKNKLRILGVTFIGLAISQIFFIYEGVIYPVPLSQNSYVNLSRLSLVILLAILITFIFIVIDELSKFREDAVRLEKEKVEKQLTLTKFLLSQEKDLLNKETILKEEILQQKMEFEDLYLVASSVEHELRNPLAVINNTFSALRAKYQSDEKLIKYLDDLESERLSMVAAVELVNILKSDNEDISFRMKKIYLLDLFKKIKKKIDIEFKGKLTDVFMKIDEEKQKLFVNGIPFLLEKVFINFIKNAIESIFLKDNKKGVIHIILNVDEKDKSKVIISIRDNGIGFIDGNGSKLSDEDIKQCISARYTTKTAEISRPNKGIGLFVSDRVVRIHDGEMKLKNNEDDGAEVIVTLDRIMD